MATENPDRRQKFVMGLGIVTILLFSANLIKAVAHHFRPTWGHDHSDVVQEIAEIAPQAESHFTVFGHGNGKVVVIRRSNAPHITVDASFNHEFEHEFEVNISRDIEISVSGDTRQR